MISLQPYSSDYQQSDLEQSASLLQQNPQGLVEQEETRYAKVISQIADYIHSHNINLLLIAGPSASGKTTTSKRLESALRKRSHRVYRISLDNFYLESDTLPHWEDGSPNFETPDSLDIPYYQKKMEQLFVQGRQEFSVFDFKTNTRGKDTFTVQYDSNTCLILEGIHALNPKLMPNVNFSALRLYISPHTQFCYGDKVMLTARQLRLTRRILRDTALRGSEPEQTLKMWDQVLRGEREYLHPFRKMADVHINTAHLYEPFLYASPFLRLMERSGRSSWEKFPKVLPVLQGMETVSKLGTLTEIPESSLICEFYHPALL